MTHLDTKTIIFTDTINEPYIYSGDCTFHQTFKLSFKYASDIQLVSKLSSFGGHETQNLKNGDNYEFIEVEQCWYTDNKCGDYYTPNTTRFTLIAEKGDSNLLITYIKESIKTEKNKLRPLIEKRTEILINGPYIYSLDKYIMKNHYACLTKNMSLAYYKPLTRMDICEKIIP
jgi:hypothetical protein